MVRQIVAADDLLAQAEANCDKREEHKEQDEGARPSQACEDDKGPYHGVEPLHAVPIHAVRTPRTSLLEIKSGLMQDLQTCDAPGSFSVPNL